jgi:hypothetical protein
MPALHDGKEGLDMSKIVSNDTGVLACQEASPGQLRLGKDVRKVHANAVLADWRADVQHPGGWVQGSKLQPPHDVSLLPDKSRHSWYGLQCTSDGFGVGSASR